MTARYSIQLDVDENGYHLTVHNVHGMVEATYKTRSAVMAEIVSTIDFEESR